MKKVFKVTAWTLLGIILALILAVGIYVVYMLIQYYRIEDNLDLEINNNKSQIITLNTNYTIATYNIGFGAYTHEFDFFMDKGEMLDGTKVSGSGSRAKDKQTVLDNTNGAIKVLKDINADFVFVQEVDTKATRSYKVNQMDMIVNSFDMGYDFAYNFHSAYLFYPIFNPHGSVEAGQLTLSKYQINSATRRSFPVATSLSKFFDLDRCFVVNRLKIDGSDKELVLINLHMSAYDEGGKIRQQQLEMLNQVLAEEYDKGNYVIAGGDFNHDIANSINLYQTEQKVPEWVFQLDDNDLAEHYKFATASNCPTCRSTDMPYEKGVNYTVVVDGFIVSDNVQIIKSENIDTDFEYSDHNPATLQFKLI